MWFDKQVSDKYPISTDYAQNIILPFPTTYLVECAFSAVSDILSDKRSKLDITERGDLRAKLTNFQPQFSDILNKHQSQGSH